MSNALDAAGPQAAWIAWLWWISLWLCAAVFVGVMAALGWALWRSHRAARATGAAPVRADRALRILVGSATLLSSALLVGLLEISILTDRALVRLPGDDALSIRVTAHQWWWEVVYEDGGADQVFHTANELVIPVGRPVEVTLEADDVIHSFWVPNLHGKKDLIPGRTSTIRFRADRAGRFVGRCAEFCGLQHAFMAYDVVAMTPERYAAWAAHERASAPEPQAADAARGRDLFVTGSCMLCHAVQGTSAQGRRGPDLTHFASRAHIGAGTVPNTPQALAQWIEDPQKLKPGANMPSHFLAPDDLAALVAYLETLT
jgi:cytochrome c oxidase subunit 2